MKIVIATLSGQPHVGDIVELHYMAPRGGRTTAGHIVLEVDEQTGLDTFRRRPQTLEEIADMIAKSAEVQYCGAKSGTPAFKAKARGATIRVECKDEVEDVTFVPEIKPANGGDLAMDLVEL